MEWSPVLKNGSIYLNQKIVRIQNKTIDLVVHYWGAQGKHLSNHIHQHSYYEVCYIIDGKGVYLEGENKKKLEKGTLFLSTPYKEHQIQSEEGVDILFIGFELVETSLPQVKELFEQINEQKLNVLEKKEESEAVHLWFSLIKLAGTDSYGKQHFEPLSETLFLNLVKEFSTQKLVKNENTRQSSRLIYQAELYINDNLSKPLTREEVAKYLYISQRHLSRLFQQELGLTFTTFIRRTKMRKAGIYLSETTIPIKDIADKLGYANIHYFSNVFSKEMGMPPGKFRETFKGINQVKKEIEQVEND